MQSEREAIEAAGGQVVAVGQGTGVEAAQVAAKFGVTFPVLGDPDHHGYRSMDLDRAGWWKLLVEPFLEDPVGGMKNLLKADFRASVNPRSDVRLLSGVAIVDREGHLRFVHRSTKTTDLPAISVLLDALRAIAE